VMPKADADMFSVAQRALGKLPYRVLCRFVRDMARAVHVLSARRVVHRDVKLENFLVYGLKVERGVVVGGEAKLSDFGFAAQYEEGELLSARLGTPTYVAPEIAAGGPYDARVVDVFSLAVCVFALLTGAKPFGANYCTVTLDAQRAWKRALPFVCEDMRRLVLGGLRVDPARRISCLEMVRLSERACARRVTPAPTGASPPRAGPSARASSVATPAPSC
jgi:serine/threonine protein kinase